MEFPIKYGVFPVNFPQQTNPLRYVSQSLVKHGVSRLIRDSTKGVLETEAAINKDVPGPVGNGFNLNKTHDGSMVLPYMVTWIPSIYPQC